MKKVSLKLTRTASVLKRPVIKAILGRGADTNSEAVKTLIEQDKEDDIEDDDLEIAASRTLPACMQSVDPLHSRWILEKKELESAQARELSLSAVNEDDPVVGAMKMLRDRFVYAARRDEVWDRFARDWISTKALTNLMAHAMPLNRENKPINALALLMRDPLAIRVHNERYIPGAIGETVTTSGVAWLNTWQAPEVTPEAGDPKPMLEHILYLCDGRQDVADALLDWLAFCYQNPGKKITYAPLIISEAHGVGKDTLRIAITRLFGASNVATLDDGAIGTGRNDFMKRAQFVCVPEIMTGDRRDIANKLKPLITQETVRIDEKHVKPYEMPNVTNFLFFSNHLNAAHIEDQDRRYFVIICRAKPRSPYEYETLYDYINGPGVGGFAQFLVERNLTNFNANGRAPETPDKRVVQQATKGGWEAWLDDAWQSGAAPFDRQVISLRDALTAISEAKGPRMTVQQIAQFLRSKGGADLDRVRLSSGERIRLWCIRDKAIFSSDLKLAAEAFERPIQFALGRLRVVEAERCSSDHLGP